MIFKRSWFIICLVIPFFISAQNTINQFLKPSDTLNSKRKTTVFTSEAVILGSALIGLNQIWYKDYPQSKFHFINDNKQWMQMDKIGHFYSTYQLGSVGANALKWSGASQKQQLVYGATLGFAFLSIVEVFDGFSKEWGASTGDILANASGTALYVSQELLWNEQRIIPKFSFHTTKFASSRPELLGSSLNEQILKDYNGQTYWLSANLYAFTKWKNVPKWLNIAVGYGAENMLFGSSNDFNYTLENIQPYRQFYLSFDVDLTKIRTKSHLLKTLFSVFNTLKIPAPTLQINGNKRVTGHLFYF